MNNLSININGVNVGEKYPPYIIAEMSANHNGSIENALNIIKHAKESGASAVKIQTYKPDTITLNSTTDDFKIFGGLWDGRTLYELYEQAHLPWEWHKPIFDFARNIGITIFSSPFDNTAVDLLENLNVPAYKIASFEIIDLPLIKYVASTRKPMIISTGMADRNEIFEAVDTAFSNGCKELALLHCVSGYPALASEYNLNTLIDMRSQFNVVTGLSDHTIDNTTAITSIALGASIIEKHFTLNRNGGGPDDSFSLEPADLAELCSKSNIAWSALGNVSYSLKPSEMSNIKFRRSLYFVKDLKSGEVISTDSVRSVRPGYGLSPKYLTDIIGKRVNKAIKINSPVNLCDIIFS